jgi:hypothetical protein
MYTILYTEPMIHHDHFCHGPMYDYIPMDDNLYYEKQCQCHTYTLSAEDGARGTITVWRPCKMTTMCKHSEVMRRCRKKSEIFSKLNHHADHLDQL